MKMKSEKIGTRRPRRVLVVDQSPVVRQAVASWLKRTLDLAVCAEADSPSSALKAAHDFKPDVIVTEILRQQDLGFIQSLHEQHPELPILDVPFCLTRNPRSRTAIVRVTAAETAAHRSKPGG